MAGEWRECSLGEVLELHRGYDLPAQSRQPGTVPIVSSSGVSGCHSEARVSGPGVVTGRYGTLGQVFFVEADFWPLNTTLYVSDFRGNDPRFISYFLHTLDFFAYADKAAVPGINRNHLHGARVRVPTSVDEQRAIAHILGALDDKIELNRRMSETLELMARALFKSWFVDFDPVRAKAEGRDPGLPNDIADLFPDALVSGESAAIPVGWSFGILGDVAENPRRGIQPEQINSATPYIGLEHIPRRSIALSEWETDAVIESNKHQFRRGEILFGKLRPYFHKVGVAPIDGVCSTDIVVVAPKSASWFGFVLAHVSSDEFVAYTSAGSTGTKMPRTSWAEMTRYAVVLPPKPLANAFSGIVLPVVERILATVHESRCLHAIRDALLPKLISGEVSVSRAERFLAREGAPV